MSSSRDIIKIFKLVSSAVNEPVRLSIFNNLKDNNLNTVTQLLFLLTGNNSHVSPQLESLLMSGNEFIALEAFSLLTRECVKQRRKPAIDFISSKELFLFQKFIDDVTFSGSIDFRQKVSVLAKSFFEQIYARIYHLIRESMKKPRETEKDTPVPVPDKEALNSELTSLFGWLGKFIENSFVYPFDFCKYNFSSVEFAFTQILAIFSAFEGNKTLVAANPAVLAEMQARFRSEVVEYALIPAVDNLISCVGMSTYDSLRIQAIEILCKCHVDASIVPINEYIPALIHPRAINNESAARIFLLHTVLSKTFPLKQVLNDIGRSFVNLKADFPSSLQANNISGRLLLLRFLLEEGSVDLEDADITDIIDVSMSISEFVSAIASHPSPEGLHIPVEDDEDADDDEIVDDAEGDSYETVSSQYILSFSWRAVKETSNLLETLLKRFPSRISKNQVHLIADHFISMLLKLRHCGAFRALQNPLSTTLRSGYSFSEKANVLKQVLEACLGTGRITATRRSAGLPFLVLALAHSCSNRGNELTQLLENLLPPLISTASNNQDAQNTPAGIHAFNIIRSLVRDSRISNEMGSHMAPIAELCLKSFNSSDWNVRNASAMLLSSLISRIFGPKHVNNLANHDHQVDLREIEVKFDGLIGVMKSFLQIGITSTRIAYPLLAILERVRIPPHERFNDFRSAMASFLLDLLCQLDCHPESGRKLGHVLGRTVFSLLHSKSLTIENISQMILNQSFSFTSTANGVYNLLVILENIQLFDSSYMVSNEFLPPIKPEWHNILISKYNQILSHKSLVASDFPEQKGSPALR